MKIEEFEAGRKVFLVHHGKKIYGLVGMAWDTNRQDIIVRLDGVDGVVFINEKTAPLFQYEPLN